MKTHLSPTEEEAKQLFFKIYSAYDIPIDSGNSNNLNPEIPKWFDEEKYQRGRKYYNENKYSYIQSVLTGVVCILGDPNIADVLYESGKSSTIELAKKRYVETLLHVLAWYEYELKKDSNSWKSLNRVRRLHLLASNNNGNNNNAMISQAKVSVTVFGYMGMAIVRPHHFGMPYDNKEDREGFIHFWAVMGHCLGVKDEYNFCLSDLDVCEVVCEMFIRYIFIPFLQFEPADFKTANMNYINGLGELIPDLTYETILFLAKRACAIPGYQYGVDIKRENIIKDMLTTDEINLLRKYVSRSKYTVQNSPRIFPEKLHFVEMINDACKFNEPKYNEDELKYKQHIEENYKMLGLKENDRFVIKTVPYEDLQLYFSNTKFMELSMSDRMILRLKYFAMLWNTNLIGNCVNNLLFGWFLKRVKGWYASNSKSKLY